MRLTQLSLTRFRLFSRFETSVPAGILLITGDNAQGKTSLLEAIYFLSTLSSFHARTDRQLISFLNAPDGLDVARIVGQYHKQGFDHTMEVRIIKDRLKNGGSRSRKEVLLDKNKLKASQAIGHFNAVFFLPQMMQIIEDSPSERRRYLNMVLSQAVPRYAQNLKDYSSILTQRNALLKQLQEHGGSQDQIEFWDQRLAERGSALLLARAQAIEELNLEAAKAHQALTGGQEVLRLDYQPGFDPLPNPAHQASLLESPKQISQLKVEKIQSGFLETLKANLGNEIARGQTSIGPHRDEIRFFSSGIDLGLYGSRGQVRSAMLSMKFAEVEWIKVKTSRTPVLLLDEVMAELDPKRRADLLHRISQAEQAILTTTDLSLFPPEFLSQAAVWRIENGRLINTKD